MPYWALSRFYFFYFAALGVIVPYWGLFLKDLGFDAVEIGELMAIPMATKFVAPFLWGWVGDHLGRRMAIVRFGSLSTLVVFVWVFWLTGFWEMGAAMALFSFFWNAILPQVEVVTLRYLRDQTARYARVRLWGSVGFIVVVVGLGFGVDRYGPGIVPMALFAVYLLIWLSTLGIRDPSGADSHEDQPSFGTVLCRPDVAGFFLASFLAQVAHGAYYSFYSIHLEEAGYDKALIGVLWAVGVIAEVAIFMGMHRLLDRHGARAMLLLSLIAGVGRWLLIGWFVESVPVLFFAQTLHAATFGTFHAAAIHQVHHYFVGRHQGRGQALYSSLSFGAGGAVGSFASGFLWSGAGATATFGAAAAVSLAALFVTWRWVSDETGSCPGGL